MTIWSVVFLSLLLVVSGGLVDDAKLQVEQLRAIIRSAIFTAFNNVDTFVSNVYYYRNDKMAEARIDFQTEQLACTNSMDTLEALGESAGVDVSDCIERPKADLAELPETLETGLLACLVFANQEVTVIQNDALYYLDIVINDVEIMDYQIEVCGENLECISPILTQIELAEVEFTQRIGVEVQKADDLAEELKVLIGQCVDDSKSEMVAQGNNLVKKAADCVNERIP